MGKTDSNLPLSVGECMVLGFGGFKTMLDNLLAPPQFKDYSAIAIIPVASSSALSSDAITHKGTDSL